MPERKSAFPYEVFPKNMPSKLLSNFLGCASSMQTKKMWSSTKENFPFKRNHMFLMMKLQKFPLKVGADILVWARQECRKGCQVVDGKQSGC